MDQVKAHPDSKATDIAIEDAEAIYAKKLDRDDSEEVPVSPLKDMPRRQAVWVFRKAVLFAMLVAWAAIMDGYLISSESTSSNHFSRVLLTWTVPGSIVANKHFIAQFCTVTEANGSCALDSVYVGAWTAVQSVGQIIGELDAHPETILLINRHAQRSPDGRSLRSEVQLGSPHCHFDFGCRFGNCRKVKPSLAGRSTLCWLGNWYGTNWYPRLH